MEGVGRLPYAGAGTLVLWYPDTLVLYCGTVSSSQKPLNPASIVTVAAPQCDNEKEAGERDLEVWHEIRDLPGTTKGCLRLGA